jgi:surface polysaccharide O-acyltransferase-like enzyme
MDRRLSLLRVIACLMVVTLHVSGEAYGRWDADWWAGNVYDSLVRACVPLFFMITGATLLGRSEPLGIFLRKRAARLLPPLLLWSTFYLWWLWKNGAGPKNWFAEVLSGPTMFHLWFFYALVGLYALVPVLRRFHQNATDAEKRWVLGLWLLVASILPTVQNLSTGQACAGHLAPGTLPVTYHLTYFGGYVGYLLLGAFLADRPHHSKSLGLGVFALASAATMVGNYWLSTKNGKPCEFFLVYLTPFVVAAAYGLFTALMAARTGPGSKALNAIADCTLGIYGLHVFIIDPVFQRQGWQVGSTSAWLSVPAISLGVFLVSLACIFFVRLAKPMRYIV